MICTHCSHDNTTEEKELFFEMCSVEHITHYFNGKVKCLKCQKMFSIPDSECDDIVFEKNGKLIFKSKSCYSFSSVLTCPDRNCSHDNNSDSLDVCIENNSGVYKNFRVFCTACKHQFSIPDSLFDLFMIRGKYSKLTFEYNPPRELK
jgi:hypothetical protein